MALSIKAITHEWFMITRGGGTSPSNFQILTLSGKELISLKDLLRNSWLELARTGTVGEQNITEDLRIKLSIHALVPRIDIRRYFGKYVSFIELHGCIVKLCIVLYI